jgi:hypothetical protein
MLAPEYSYANIILRQSSNENERCNFILKCFEGLWPYEVNTFYQFT